MPESELLKVVYEDLCWLAEEVDSDPDESHLRRCAPILRKLLLDNLLQLAWKSAGFEKTPIIEAPNLQEMLSGVDTKDLVVAMSGRIRSKEAEMGPFAEWRGARARENALDSFIPFNMFSFGLSHYVNSAAFYFRHKYLNRRELIQYVSYRKGGVHFGAERKNHKRELAFKYLGEIEGHYKFMGYSPIYFEYLGTVRHLVNSDDIKRLKEALGPQ